MTFLDVTVDGTAANPVTTATHDEVIRLGPDAGQRGASPVVLDPFDADRDELPDAMEPHLCRIQNDNRPEDGTCPTADKQDYIAPAGVPNPWRRS